MTSTYLVLIVKKTMEEENEKKNFESNVQKKILRE